MQHNQQGVSGPGIKPSIATNPVDRRTIHKAVTWWDHIRAPVLCANTRIGSLRNNSTTFTKTLNFLLVLYLVFCFVFLFLFILWVFSALLTLPSLFSYFPIPTPSLSLLFLCYNPLFSFPTTLPAPSHPLSPLSSPPFPSPPNHSPHYCSLLHILHPLTSLMYQLYTTPAPSNPWHKHPPLQEKYIQTCTRATKPNSPHTTSPTHPHLFLCLF
jgi:hypothetical protein